MHFLIIYKAFIGMFQKFKQKGREEQCEPDDKEKGAAKHVAALLGVDREQMMKAFCKPKIKVSQ